MNERYPGPRKVFTSREEVEALTYEEAKGVICDARDLLRATLDADVEHMHWLDDCGDYLAAAIDNYRALWMVYWENDGDEAMVVQEVKKFLLTNPDDYANDPPDFDYPYGGSDGEVRFTLVPFIADPEG